MSLLDAPGDLARTPLAAVLLEARERRASGVLEIAHGGGTSRLWFHDGAPVGAQVFVGFRPLGHMLLKAGVIDIDTLSRSLVRMAETRRPHGEILVEMGAASRDQIEHALEEQQAGYAAQLAALPEGPFAFEPSAEVPGWTRAGLLSPLRVLTDALAAPAAADLVGVTLGRVEAGAVRLGAAYAGEGERGLVGEERRLVARLTSPCSLDAYLGAAELPPEHALALLAALLLLDLAVLADAGERTASAETLESSRRRSPPSPRRPRRRRQGGRAIPPRRVPGGSASFSGGCGTWAWGRSARGLRRAPTPTRTRTPGRDPGNRRGRRVSAATTRFAMRSSPSHRARERRISSRGSASPMAPGGTR